MTRKQTYRSLRCVDGVINNRFDFILFVISILELEASIRSFVQVCWGRVYLCLPAVGLSIYGTVV